MDQITDNKMKLSGRDEILAKSFCGVQILMFHLVLLIGKYGNSCCRFYLINTNEKQQKYLEEQN